VASLPTPDLRGVEYRRIDAIRRAERPRPRAGFLRHLVAGALHSLVRLAVGSFTTNG